MRERRDTRKPPGAGAAIIVVKVVAGMIAGILLTVGSCAGGYSGRRSTEATREWWDQHLWTAMIASAVVGGVLALVLSAVFKRRSDRRAAQLAEKFRKRARDSEEGGKADFPDDF